MFAARDYKADELVALYLGEVYPKAYRSQIADSTYLRDDGAFVIDGSQTKTDARGFGRWINHSETPNCKWELIWHDKQATQYRGINAKRDIAKGEELTIDYGKVNLYFNDVQCLLILLIGSGYWQKMMDRKVRLSKAGRKRKPKIQKNKARSKNKMTRSMNGSQILRPIKRVSYKDM